MNNPIKKINFECDLGATEIPFVLSNGLRLDIGNWQIALDSVSFEAVATKQDSPQIFIFKLSSSLVTDYKTEGGQCMVKYTNLGRFHYSFKSREPPIVTNFPFPKWFPVNNYQSENITFFLQVWPAVLSTNKKSNLFPLKKVNVSIDILLQRIN